MNFNWLSSLVLDYVFFFLYFLVGLYFIVPTEYKSVCVSVFVSPWPRVWFIIVFVSVASFFLPTASSFRLSSLLVVSLSSLLLCQPNLLVLPELASRPVSIENVWHCHCQSIILQMSDWINKFCGRNHRHNKFGNTCGLITLTLWGEGEPEPG